MITTIIWVIFLLLGVFVAFLLWRDYLKHKNNLESNSWAKTGIIGFIGNFFDTLGIGSFAIETALFKFTKQVEDRLLPGTLNVANAIATITQAIIFIQIVKVEPITLAAMLIAAALGAVLGAGIVSKFSERKVRLTMGIALFIACGFMIASQLKLIEGGGTTVGLQGTKLAIAVGVNFILGALMTAGIGLYAPCMALVFALGMSPDVAFPIMMGSCAVLMPLASARFIKEGAYNRKAAISISITGVIAVLIAAFIVKSLPLDVLKWLVIVVIIYTATVMLRAGLRKENKG